MVIFVIEFQYKFSVFAISFNNTLMTHFIVQVLVLPFHLILSETLWMWPLTMQSPWSWTLWNYFITRYLNVVIMNVIFSFMHHFLPSNCIWRWHLQCKIWIFLWDKSLSILFTEQRRKKIEHLETLIISNDNAEIMDLLSLYSMLVPRWFTFSECLM